MFERFTQAAKNLVLEAQAQRRVMHHHEVRTEHLLLALLADPGSSGGVLRQQGLEAGRIMTRSDEAERTADQETTEHDDQLLRELGIDVDAIRRSVDETLGPGALDRVRADRSSTGNSAASAQADEVGEHGGFDLLSKRVLELSLRETLRLKTRHIGPEHIGLGILRENRSAAYQLLVVEGFDVAALRTSWETIALQARRHSHRNLVQRLRS